MNLRAYVAPLLKWWWLLLAAPALAGGSSYLAVKDLPSSYQTHATLMIGTVIQDPTPNSGDLFLAQQLASSYADIANRQPLRDRTMSALRLSFLPSTFVRSVPNSTLIEVWVTDIDPVRAQVVANEMANQMILTSPGAADSADATRQKFINDQLDNLQSQIQETDLQIQNLQEQLGTLNAASQISDIQNQIAAQQAKLHVLQSNFAALLATSQQGATNTLSLIEAAPLPFGPIGPNRLLTVAIAAAIGLGMAALAAYGIEALDDTVKPDEDFGQLVNAPVLAQIGEISHSGGQGVYIADNPQSLVAEAFRSLRTNLEFAAVDRPLKTLLITSASPSDGKTLVASNLAAMIAKGGKRVTLLDADLRNPGIHARFGLSNTLGLSDVFLGKLNIANAVNPWDDDHLGVIPAGSPPPNPTELISSEKMDDIVVALKEQADFVVIDAAPFVIADAWVLAAKVDAVLMVIRPGRTHRNAIRSTQEQITRSGARLVGIALNHMPRSQEQIGSGSLRTYYGRTSQSPPPVLTGERANVTRAQASLELLNAIGRILAAEHNLREVWKSILQLVMERMGATGGGILLLNQQGEVIDGAVAYKGRVLTSVERRLSETATRGLAGWVIENRQGVVIPNTLDDPRWLRRPWEQRDATPRSAISVPLIALNRPVGVLTLTHAPGGYFDDDDLALLTAVSSMISVIGVPPFEATPDGPDGHHAPHPQDGAGSNGKDVKALGVKDPE